MRFKIRSSGDSATIALLMPLQVAHWPIGFSLAKLVKNPRASGASNVLFEEPVFCSASPSY